jgi:putative membrane protein insertion efficiency factor
MPRVFLRLPIQALSLTVIGLVRIYQYTLSPMLSLLFGSSCRFQPSCSQYMVLAVQKHGPLRGTAKGIWRICRCHPWSAGGHDPP